MKVDNLLAQYLYQYKKLSLTGIGIFTLDDSAVLSDDNAKTKAPIEGISFVSKLIAQFDDSLIEFIKLQTGKMKALAQADLDSYVMLAHQFLNIGKPFYLEGIGTLQKNRDGSFNFHAGTSLPVKSDENDPKKKQGSTDETNAANEKSSINYRGLILGAGIIATLLVIAWGGYYLYNKNTDNNNAAQNSNVRIMADSQVTKNIAPDTANQQANPASSPPAVTAPATTVAQPTVNPPANPPATVAHVPTNNTPENGFKFVLETPHKRRALMRYEKIKDSKMLEDFDSKVQMETTDSVNFKIFIVVPCQAADTTHYKDLLNAWYYGNTELKVKIEH